MYLDENNLKEGGRLLDRLEALTPDAENVKWLKAELYTKKRSWKKAGAIYGELLKGSPGNIDYHSAYAYVLGESRDLEGAKKEYRIILKDPKRKKEYAWPYKNLLERAGTGVRSNVEYAQGPQSLWWFKNSQGVTTWITNKVRMIFNAFEETYRQKKLGDTPSISESPVGHYTRVDWFLDNVTLGIDHRADYVRNKDYHEFGVHGDAEFSNLHWAVDYNYNRLIKSPVDALVKKARYDDLRSAEDVLFFDHVRLGHNIESQWIHIPEGENQVNEGNYLGNNLINNVFAELIVFTDPLISFNVNYKNAYWARPFTRANEVVGFFTAEQAWSGGFFYEERLLPNLAARASMTRNYDYKRDVFSTYSNFSLDWWFFDFAKAGVGFEYMYGDSGLNGSGNTQITKADITVYF
ncbi:MAG: hypothetical protein HQL28_07430 [Candidatus Omnitrophica bacterium]|nr:hypothetical protein [Candidatus Omnitrophota bacterium]